MKSAIYESTSPPMKEGLSARPPSSCAPTSNGQALPPPSYSPNAAAAAAAPAPATNQDMGLHPMPQQIPLSIATGYAAVPQYAVAAQPAQFQYAPGPQYAVAAQPKYAAIPQGSPMPPQRIVAVYPPGHSVPMQTQAQSGSKGTCKNCDSCSSCSEWDMKYGLCDCFGDWDSCCTVSFCPYIAAGRIYESGLNKNFMGGFCLLFLLELPSILFYAFSGYWIPCWVCLIFILCYEI